MAVKVTCTDIECGWQGDESKLKKKGVLPDLFAPTCTAVPNLCCPHCDRPIPIKYVVDHPGKGQEIYFVEQPC